MSVFVDTSAWFASVVPGDRFHLKVVTFLRENRVPLVTSDYVVDETLTLLRARGEREKAIVLGRHFFDLRLMNIVHVSPEILIDAWEIFRDQPDRKWSLTDCTSKVIMDRRHIRIALSLDQHFAEFGAFHALA